MVHLYPFRQCAESIPCRSGPPGGNSQTTSGQSSTTGRDSACTASHCILLSPPLAPPALLAGVGPDAACCLPRSLFSACLNSHSGRRSAATLCSSVAAHCLCPPCHVRFSVRRVLCRPDEASHVRARTSSRFIDVAGASYVCDCHGRVRVQEANKSSMPATSMPVGATNVGERDHVGNSEMAPFARCVDLDAVPLFLFAKDGRGRMRAMGERIHHAICVPCEGGKGGDAL